MEKKNNKYENLSREQLIKMLEEKEETIQKISTKPKRSAHRGAVKNFNILIMSKLNPMEQVRLSVDDITQIISDELESGAVKVGQKLEVRFTKVSSEGDVLRRNAFFRSGPEIVTNQSQIKEAINDSSKRILNRIDKWTSEGSGWTIDGIYEHELSVYEYAPTPTHDHRTGSSFMTLPKELQAPRKGLVNMRNEFDHKCFLWSHVRHISPDARGGRISKKDRETAKTLDYTGIEFPVRIRQIPKIEKANSIRINVFGYEFGRFLPYYIGKAVANDIMDLLLISDEKGNSHYVLINNINRLFYKATKHGGRKFFCRNCIQAFTTEKVLEKHRENCLAINGEQAVTFPKEGSVIRFKSVAKQLTVPFMIYADFESIMVPPEPEDSFSGTRTERLNVHKCCGFAYKLICSYDEELSKSVVCYRGEDAADVFLRNLMQEEKWCQLMLRKHFREKIRMTAADKKLFNQQKDCHICGKSIPPGPKEKVADHCHFSGKFRGAAHASCNLKYRLTDQIPVVFHNLRGYDGHFIIPELGNFKRRPDVIPNNMESYKAIFWGKLRFIDSFQFMSSALTTLADNLPKDSFTNTDREFREVYSDRADELLELVKRKGVYPYNYFDSFEKFSERKLPSKSEFYNELTEEHVSDADYEHAKNVWKKFRMKTLGDYHDLYLTTDVLLLADVFEKFRKTCENNYKLDPAHYVSAPSLSWDAMLKFTGITLELVSDPDIYQMVEKGMRGGVSFVSTRMAKPNNEFTPDYNPDDPKSWIIYLDANNLYGNAMSEPLPTGGLRFLGDSELNSFNLNETPDGKGYFLEVDISYPESIHEKMRYYPVAPEKSSVPNEMLSPLQRVHEVGSTVDRSVRLMATLRSKKKYVLHYRNLIYYLSLGVKLEKVRRIIEFDESPFLRDYIAFNTTKRQTAANSFEKNFYKLMNNSVYGKTCENLRKRRDIRIINNKKTFNKLANRPSFKHCNVISENLTVVERIKERLLLNKPIYIGNAVLELSKLHMYKFHYDWVYEKYGSKAKLLFTDTDSLTYLIETENVYDDMFAEKELFDFSNYPKDSQYFCDENKAVLGKMKDECPGSHVVDFVGLRAKMYSYLLDNEKEVKKAKGVKKSVVKKVLRHQNYRDVVAARIKLRHKQKGLRSSNHKIFTYEMDKASLNGFDKKVFILSDGINCLPHGHCETGITFEHHESDFERTLRGSSFRIVNPNDGDDENLA